MIIDKKDWIQESDETNNTLSISPSSIAQGPLPNLRVGEAVQETGCWRITIENTGAGAQIEPLELRSFALNENRGFVETVARKTFSLTAPIGAGETGSFQLCRNDGQSLTSGRYRILVTTAAPEIAGDNTGEMQCSTSDTSCAVFARPTEIRCRP